MLSPLFPPPARRGRKPVWPVREIVNAIFYVLRGGIPWRLIPKDLPPKSTVFGYFCRWRDTGLFTRINRRLVTMDRERIGRQASPSAAVLDSQSLKTTESGGPRGYDAGKKIKGRKRQAMVDMDGRALILDPQPADIQDRDGAIPVLRVSRRSFPFVEKAFADMGYSGDRPQNATLVDVEIVRKPKDQVGFAVHPKRWVVERFFAWISRNRRLWKNPGGDDKVRRSLPLCCIHHDADQTHRTVIMNSRTDSEFTAKLQIRETIAFETKKAEFVEKLLILTIGPNTFVDRETVYAWREAGVELIGPVLSISQISPVAVALVVGAIIDLDLDIDALILLTDQLDALGIPAIFAGSQTGKAQTSGFCMSREREAIAAIMAALLAQHKVTKH